MYGRFAYAEMLCRCAYRSFILDYVQGELTSTFFNVLLQKSPLPNNRLIDYMTAFRAVFMKYC